MSGSQNPLIPESVDVTLWISLEYGGLCWLIRVMLIDVNGIQCKVEGGFFVCLFFGRSEVVFSMAREYEVPRVESPVLVRQIFEYLPCAQGKHKTGHISTTPSRVFISLFFRAKW